MNTKNLFLKALGLLAAGALILAVSACDNPTDPEPGGGPTYNDTPVTSLKGTRWTDGLLPESTIEFTDDTHVELTGRYFEQIQAFSGQKTCEIAADLTGSKVEPAVLVIINATKRTGFEIDLFQASKTDTVEKHQRLVVWTGGRLLQPREFYLQ
jgi:hypothetical protein